jgi:hypothetical protein
MGFRIFFFMLMASTLYAQESDFSEIKTLEIEGIHVEIDRLQQIYVVQKGGGLEKYSAEGKLLFRFNENNLGEIKSIDVSNPHQLLLFFGDYQTIVLLDRSLSEINRFDLTDLGYLQVEAVGLSSDNQIWVYDPNELLLQKIDQNGELVQESPDLSAILDDAFMPNRLIERDYQVFLNDPDYGVMIFDVFGNYQKTLEIKGLSYFQWREGALQWLDFEKGLRRFQLASFQEKIIKLKSKGLETEGLLQLAQVNTLFCARYLKKIKIFQLD